MGIELFGFLLEIITALIATVTWNKYKLTNERDFIYFFWLITIIDISGYLIQSFCEFENYFIYNLLFLFYFIFILRWFFKILDNKKVVKTLILLYILIVILSVIKQRFFNELLSIHFVGGALIVVISSLLYFKQILNSNEILIIKNSLPFWLTIGNIIYFVGMLPLIILQKYLNISNYAYLITILFVNFITYFCYSLGFLWMKKKS